MYIVWRVKNNKLFLKEASHLMGSVAHLTLIAPILRIPLGAALLLM